MLNSKIQFWDLINEYVISCNGDPSNKTISLHRMRAVVNIEKMLASILESERKKLCSR